MARMFKLALTRFWFLLLLSVQSEEFVDLVRGFDGAIVAIEQKGRNGGASGMGAGFLIEEGRFLVTCLHVIGEGREFEVKSADGQEYAVDSVFASDVKTDLAILKLAASTGKGLKLASNSDLPQGSSIAVMGHPLGLENSVSRGLVSAKRFVDNVEMLQISAPIESGHSGGPVTNSRGDVVGVVVAKSGLKANIGFAALVEDIKLLLAHPNPTTLEQWLTMGMLDTTRWMVPAGGEWRQRAGRIRVNSPGEGFGGRALCLLKEASNLDSFELAVCVKLDNESGAAGLAFCSDGGDKHYGFYPSNGQMRLTRFDGPSVYTWNILEQASTPAYRPGDWNYLKVRVEPDQIDCFVNGTLVFSSDDAGFRGGQIGMAKFRETEAEFRWFECGAQVSEYGLVTESLRNEVLSTLEAVQNGNQEAWERLTDKPFTSVEVIRAKARELEYEAARLKSLATALHRVSAKDELVQVFSVDSDDEPLLRAGLLVARLDDPEMDVSAYIQEIERLENQVRRQLRENADARERSAVLRRFLFEERGFHGSRLDYFQIENSYLSRVIDDREGLPITLSVLYMELGRRLGVRVEGIGLPGKFVVQEWYEDGSSAFVDPFDRGRIMSRSDLIQIVLDYTGNDDPEPFLDPVTDRQIITRMLINMLALVEGEDYSRALVYADVLVALNPGARDLRTRRMRLRYLTGDNVGAMQDLRNLESTRSGL